MAFTDLTDNLNIIQALDDEPNDVGGLTAAELKEKFDEAGNKIKTYLNATLVPELEAKEGAASLGAKDAAGGVSTVQEELDKISALGDVTATADKIDDAVAKRHSHSNKVLLDTYTQTEANLSDAVSKKHSHESTDGQISAAVAAKHTHNNKALLDTYAQTESSLADAVSKKHNHTNKDVLDGITAEKVSAWDGKSDFSGSYNDLEDKPSIPAAQIQSDWNQTDQTAKDFIKNKPSAYSLPVATETALGGVKPVSKTSAMTQDVGVDGNGKLYTAPGGGGGGSGDMLKSVYDPQNRSEDIFSAIDSIPAKAVSDANLNELFTPGMYLLSGSITNGPTGFSPYNGTVLLVESLYTAYGYVRQTLFYGDASGAAGFCTRTFSGPSSTPTEWAYKKSDKSDIFRCTATTTSAEVEAAYQAGKAIFVDFYGMIMPFQSRETATKHYFGVSLEDISYTLILNADTWEGPTITNLLKKSGDTMTGALTLSGDPTANLHAATKQYVDNKYTYGTTDIEAGSASSYETGHLHFVYEA